MGRKHKYWTSTRLKIAIHTSAVQATKKTVLILGGTGYLGQFLVQELIKDHKVLAPGCLPHCVLAD